MKLSDYGPVPELAGREGIPARICAVRRDRFALVSDRGEEYAQWKGQLYHGGAELLPTVGDYVLVRPVENGDSRILEVLPRRTVFLRRAPGPVPRSQAVAANFDYVFLLQSLNHDFNPRRLERYLALAWQSGAEPVILLTKGDLTEDYRAYLTRVEGVAMGVHVHVVSARTGQGLERLKGYLQPGKTVVFLGSSGVGKSSLVNALAGEAHMAVGAIREDDSRGRHTTTHRQLLRLKCGACVIDTPGMRELGMWEADTGLGEVFPDVEVLLGKCRFSDCSHTTEPGCAIRTAIEAGTLDAGRWARYRKLKNESADQAELLRRKREWSKGVAKCARNRRKEVW